MICPHCKKEYSHTPVLVRSVLEYASKISGFTIEQITSNKRGTWDMSELKHIVAYVLSKGTNLKHKYLAQKLGYKNHSSIGRAKEKVQSMVDAGYRSVRYLRMMEDEFKIDRLDPKRILQIA